MTLAEINIAAYFIMTAVLVGVVALFLTRNERD